MAAVTPTTAFSSVPDSTEKTGLINAFNSVNTAIDAAALDGAFNTTVAVQLKDSVADLAESVAANMIDHE